MLAAVTPSTHMKKLPGPLLTHVVMASQDLPACTAWRPEVVHEEARFEGTLLHLAAFRGKVAYSHPSTIYASMGCS